MSLNLASKFSMYQANFNSLPDSISSSASNTGKDKLNLKRLVLKVDGVIKGDSVMASGYFAAGQNVSVYFDYIGVGGPPFFYPYFFLRIPFARDHNERAAASKQGRIRRRDGHSDRPFTFSELAYFGGAVFHDHARNPARREEP